MNSFDEVFEQVKRYCAEHELISQVAMETWINTMVPVSLDGKKAVFQVDTEFQQGIILNSYKKHLKTALEDVTGFTIDTIDVVVNTQSKETLATSNHHDGQIDEKHEELQKSYEFAEYDYTFDTFIVGRSNEFAFAACKAVASDTAASYNPLFIYGASGLGKTHLVTAIKHEVMKANPDRKAIYVTGETFGNELIKSIDQRDTTVFHDKYRQADVLIVDDIQFFSGKERMQEEFFHTFNKLHSEGKQIVITSDKPPRELKTLEERIRSRFECGLIADISVPDFETRYAIIRRKAELLDLKIPNEVVEFISTRLKTNIRQLEGAVKKLKALKMLANTSPTISMAQSVIRDILTDDQPIPITVEKIIAEVANVYGITADDIRSGKRTSQISTARKVAAYVVREVTGMPLAAIGMEFGGRDHSTIVYAINTVNDAIRKDSNLKDLVDDIIKDIREKNPTPSNGLS
ncbi:MAG: chromosomal replication initiator protein DnaA [Oscillospiraceae bacterium]|nr:chromosomal replication initiator protein DnaA [Oscillospiraceae bacterium]MDE7093621.1 chromosomal replication initiator protein DnaA [Oscillospiraceae bacterium]